MGGGGGGELDGSGWGGGVGWFFYALEGSFIIIGKDGDGGGEFIGLGGSPPGLILAKYPYN